MTEKELLKFLKNHFSLYKSARCVIKSFFPSKGRPVHWSTSMDIHKGKVIEIFRFESRGSSYHFVSYPDKNEYQWFWKITDVDIEETIKLYHFFSLSEELFKIE